jgi:class 3 adenylate cyclase/tetratricopeptide (TPR) repeat protein
MRCVACQHELAEGARFCQQCGTRVEAASASSAALALPEGERKQVTVLFADLKGSMELLAGRDPEDARALLDAVLQHMMEAVHHFGGTVNQVMGDGIMALFGAPLALEDHAVRACHAALRMQDAVQRFARSGSVPGAALAAIRVGINSGEVAMRSISSDLRMDYTAVGQTTHLAARMEQLASPGVTLLGPATRAMVEGLVDLRDGGIRPVKGLGEPLPVYELVGTRRSQSRLQAGHGRELTPFIGRAAELARLQQALALARQGRGQHLTLVGEAGAGKSRLLHELVQGDAARGWWVLAAAAVSYGRRTPFLLLAELMADFLGFEAGDDDAARVERVRARAAEGGEGTCDALLSLLGLPGAGAAWQRSDPGEKRHQTLAAAAALLQRASRERPLLVIIENLHWIDAQTQAFIDTLAATTLHDRVVLLCSCRPEHTLPAAQTAVPIAALDAPAAQVFVANLLGDDSSVAAVGRLLVERTQGNPFFLEETVRSLVESGALAGVPGALRLQWPLDNLQVPATVQAVLAARIDRLRPADKLVLQAAAVIGRDVVLPLLAAAAAMGEPDTAASLARLEAAGLLYTTATHPQHALSFKHALTQSVAYGSLLREQRRALHARLVPALEALHAGRLPEHADLLARHALGAELWPQALHHLRLAAEQAAARSAYVEAAALLQQALAVLPRLADGPASAATAIDLRLALRQALLPLGRFDEILHLLQQALALAELAGDRPRGGRVQAFLAAWYWWRGQPDAASQAADHALLIADECADTGLAALAQSYLGQILYTRAEYTRAVAVLEAAARLEDTRRGERFGPGVPLAAFSRIWLVFTHSERGDFGAAAEEAARAEAGAVGHLYTRVVLASAVGYSHILQGALDDAIRVLERAHADARQNMPTQLDQVATRLGHAYALAGRHGEALALLSPACMALKATYLINLSIQLAWLADAWLRAGRLDAAQAVAAEALALARQCREPGNEAWVHWTLGRIAQSGGQPAEASAAFDAARVLALRHGMPPLLLRLDREAGFISAGGVPPTGAGNDG